MSLFDLQKAILNAIKKNEVTAIAKIYDYVPKAALFPFIVIGDDRADEYNTKNSKGFITTSTIYLWGKERSMKEIKNLISILERLLSKDIGSFEFYKITEMSTVRHDVEYVKGTIIVQYKVMEDN